MGQTKYDAYWYILQATNELPRIFQISTSTVSIGRSRYDVCRAQEIYQRSPCIIPFKLGTGKIFTLILFKNTCVTLAEIYGFDVSYKLSCTSYFHLTWSPTSIIPFNTSAWPAPRTATIRFAATLWLHPKPYLSYICNRTIELFDLSDRLKRHN